MRAWYFTEFPYPYLPPFDELSSIRVNIPSKHFDPRIGADLYNRYLDEHMIADEAGLDLMVNEHHQTATCINSCATLSLAVLARQTKKARLLHPRQSDRQPRRPDPHRRGNGDDRLHLARPPRRRLRARRAL